MNFRRIQNSILALCGLICGCNAYPVTHEISVRPLDKEIDGVPVRVTTRQQIEVFQKQGDGSYSRVFDRVDSMPDQAHVFATGIHAGTLSDNKLILTLNSNGTIKQVDVTATPKGNDALSQLGTSVSNVATSAATLKSKLDDTH